MSDLEFCKWASACRNKKGYSKMKHARAEIERLRRSGSCYGGGALTSYRCVFCGKIHIGHSPLTVVAG